MCISWNHYCLIYNDRQVCVVLLPYTEYKWTKEVCYEAVYAHCYEDLVEHMVPEYLVPPLVTAGYLAPEEVDNMISPCIAPRPRSMFMLSRLARTLREKTDYYFFFSILREETEHCTHQRLEKSLVDTCIGKLRIEIGYSELIVQWFI